MKMPPCVRPAAHFYHSALWLSEEGVIGGIGVGLQMTAIASQKLFRPGSLSRRGIVIHRRNMVPIADIRPDASLACLKQFPVQYFHRRVVGSHHFGSQYKPLQ